MERAHAYRLMDASTVVRNLSPMGDNSGMVLSNSQYGTNWSQGVSVGLISLCTRREL